MTGDELRALCEPMRRWLKTRKLGLHQTLIADAIAVLSFGEGRTFASIPEQQDLARAIPLDKTVVSRVIAELKELKVLRDPDPEPGVLELEADLSKWAVAPRMARSQPTAAWAQLVRIQRGPQQANFLEPQFEDAMAEVSREEAARQISREAATSLPTQSQASECRREDASSPAPVSMPGNPGAHGRHDMRALMAESLRSTGQWSEKEIGQMMKARGVEERSTEAAGAGKNDQPAVEERSTEPRAGARHAGHEHEHDDPASQDMIHAHVLRGSGEKRKLRPIEQLSAAQREIWDELKRLLSTEELRPFETTNRLRIEDWPKAEHAAIREVSMMKKEGRIKQSVGGALNDQFHRFKSEIYRRVTAENT